MQFININIALAGLLLVVCSCSNNDEVTPEENNLQQVTSVSESGLQITLLAEKSLEVGYNDLTLEIKDMDGNAVDGEATVVPIMDMSSMQHSCPLEYTSGKTLVNGQLKFNAAFVMPSGDMGSWNLKVSVADKAVEMPIEVTQPELSRLTSFVSPAGDDETKYFICLIEPNDPQVGKNDIHLAIYKKQSMMEWPAVDDVTIEMTPWMPSMDHGSPNNTNPVFTENGHYEGKVNFTMTGDWQIKLKLTRNGVVIGEPYFDLYFN